MPDAPRLHERWQAWERAGVMASEMEASTLYVVSMIRGKKAPILGRVCMDQFMVDVTNIPEAMEGDEVVLLGKAGEEEITAEFLGELSGRFNYELVCDFGQRIPRVYVRDGQVEAVKDYDEDCHIDYLK